LAPDSEIGLFLEALRGRDSGQNTLRSYGGDLRHFGKWFAGTTGETFKAASVTPTDVRDYRAYMVAVKRLKPATVNRRLTALRRFCEWAKVQGLIAEVPTQQVKGVASSEVAPRHLSKREADRLTRAVERYGTMRDIAIVQVLRHTGLRVAELCELRDGDLRISDRRGELVVREGKGEKYREVPVNLDARKALADWLAVRPAGGDGHLFIGQRLEGLRSRQVENLVSKYARLAELEGVTPHTLRHTCAKALLDSGVDLVTVAKVLGHDSLETTKRYLTPTAADLQEAVRRLERDYVDERGT